MNITNAPDSATTTVTSSLPEKLLNVLVSPVELFDELACLPARLTTWVVPTLLVCLTSALLVRPAPIPESAPLPPPGANAVSAEGETPASAFGDSSSEPMPAETPRLTGPGVGGLVVVALNCAAILVATGWSAFVLWFIGRVFLRTHFPFGKAIEVVALAGTILVLGGVITALLGAVSGDANVRPALSMVAGHWDARTLAAFDLMNLFHLWATTILALGLSRLAGVGFRESAFWVFGYWIFTRLALILLA